MNKNVNDMKKAVLLVLATLAIVSSCAIEQIEDATLEVQDIEVPYGVAETLIPVESNGNWAATSLDADWCKLTDAQGTGNGAIKATIEANVEQDERKAIIKIVYVSGTLTKMVNVVQEAAPQPPFKLDKSTIVVPSVPPPDAYTIGITSNGTWEATSSQPWCTITPPTSGTGDGTIKVKVVTANTDTTPREAILTVTSGTFAPQTVKVTQTGTTLAAMI
jgi:hypothetical protein